ncbi:hypothetical protein ABI59_17845 [Acidobacteria bacterium Mor1]|nr:hypothetical protein ABI59_17845 [Acidobacteria bacterium Mor1]
MRRFDVALTLLGLILTAVACGPGDRVPNLDDRGYALAGHDDLVTLDGRLVPRVIRPDASLRLCLETRIGEDVSEWSARLAFENETGVEPLPVSRVSGGSVCFERVLPPALDEGRAVLSLQVVDAYDGAVVLSDRLTLLIDRDNPVAAAVRAEYRDAIRKLGRVSTGDYVDEMTGVSRRAREAELPLLAASADAIAAYALRRDGSEASRATAGRLLRSPGPWFGHPLAAPRTADWHYERGALAQAQGPSGPNRLPEAWLHFSEADRQYSRVASPKGINAATKRAEILRRRGKGEDAVDLIDRALSRCADCEPIQRSFARNSQAFMIAADPSSTSERLERARSALRQAIAELPEEAQPLERVNLLVNQGLLDARAGVVDEQLLALAVEVLERGVASDVERARELRPWVPLARGVAALVRGDPAGARRHCASIAATEPRVVAARAACLAEAWSEGGEIDRAWAAIAEALEIHQVGEEAATRALPRRDHDIRLAAWIALERGDPEQAWELLESLDRVTAEPPSFRNGAERKELLSALRTLHRPAGLSAQALRDAQMDDVRRQLTDSAESPEFRDGGDDDSRPKLRYGLLRDELVILRRHSFERVSVLRRTPVDAAELQAWTREIEIALQQGVLDDPAWRELAGRFGPLLVPPPSALSPRIELIAHGILQRVPFAALPLGDGWLGDRTQVAHVVASIPRSRSTEGGHSVFVTDPTGDLYAAARSRAVYQRLFPQARQLGRSEAKVEALLAAVPGARWLHLDAHAEPDLAYPGLSRFRLADADVFVEEILAVGNKLELVNLSGCRTGAQRISAGGGRFGMGGAFAGQGVPHVVATRADVRDELVADFNEHLYTTLSAGGDVPTAYSAGLKHVSRRHPAVRWGALILLTPSAARGDTL